MINDKKELTNKFKKDGYVHLENLISTELRDFVTQYALFDEIQNFHPEGDNGGICVPNAHYKYADPAMETLLIVLHPLMEEYTDLKLYPTYSYFRIYRKGDILKKHTDRESCEISCSLCFNYSYDDVIYNNPFIIDEKKVNLKPGDCVIYKGRELEHQRPPIDAKDDEDWLVQGFFHYVDANGRYTEHKFDKRDMIGLPDWRKKSIKANKDYDSKSYITYL